ncbi:uncharacterized protein EI97DRAFT_497351 [Westerdykella ornata]|uniref:Uncharacterized protein n=1 Tax=Westerdykella ornata TaxID=318751 RepID=A0A6A6J6J1_WESOR|nr:uncharacterized protein EI97DRAFT_497351 [Westerdykella ornata]KAF2271256.1 hypothetical protein EI97DRAFT_497351 [Westerdykella ornata]
MPAQPRDENIFLHAEFDLHALLCLAKRLRKRACTCELSQRPIGGSFNWTIVLSFDDGVEWIFRSPRTHRAYGIHDDAAALLLASEAATLKYIKKHSSIPVPEVFYYSCTKSNEVGVPFILMSKAPGSVLSTRWQAELPGMPNDDTKSAQYLTQEDKEKVMKQLGAITAQLLHLRVDKIGSLFEEEGSYTVKECLSLGHMLHERCTFEEICRGPFDEEQDYYNSLLSAYRQHIQYLPMLHHIFFAPVPLPLEYRSYASYLSATDRWNDFVTPVPRRHDPHFHKRLRGTPTSRSGVGFPIRHHDLSTNNIFVDNDCNITCIIDWQFASSVPVSELLATPGMPHPRDQPEPFLVSAFRAGVTSHLEREGETINPSVLEVSEKVWHFVRLTDMDALQDYNHFAELLMSVSKKPMDIPKLFREQYNEKSISEMLEVLAADDDQQSDIARRENEYFSAVGRDREAISRKFTMALELNRGFIADGRLWRWMEDALASTHGPNGS